MSVPTEPVMVLMADLLLRSSVAEPTTPPASLETTLDEMASTVPVRPGTRYFLRRPEAADPTRPVTVLTTGKLSTVSVSPDTSSCRFKLDVTELATFSTSSTTGATDGRFVAGTLERRGAARTLEPRLKAATERAMNFMLTSTIES